MKFNTLILICIIWTEWVWFDQIYSDWETLTNGSITVTSNQWEQHKNRNPFCDKLFNKMCLQVLLKNIVYT